QSPDSLRFPVETLELIRADWRARVKGLEGHQAADVRVTGFVDNTHPAPTQHLKDFVSAELPGNNPFRHTYPRRLSSNSVGACVRVVRQRSISWTTLTEQGNFPQPRPCPFARVP